MFFSLSLSFFFIVVWSAAPSHSVVAVAVAGPADRPGCGGGGRGTATSLLRHPLRVNRATLTLDRRPTNNNKKLNDKEKKIQLKDPKL